MLKPNRCRVLVLLRTVFLLFFLLPWLGHFVVLIFPLKNNDYYYSVYLIYILLQLNYCIKCFQDFLNPFWLYSSCICRVTPAASCVSNTHTHTHTTQPHLVVRLFLNVWISSQLLLMISSLQLTLSVLALLDVFVFTAFRSPTELPYACAHTLKHTHFDVAFSQKMSYCVSSY